MAKRSLQASPSGIKLAKQKFASRGWTQEYLANEVGIKTRQPIWRFFAGRAIERYTFMEICVRLDLDWRKTALTLPSEQTMNNEMFGEDEFDNLDNLVQMVRSQRQEKVNHQCAILQLLDINRPVSIDQIYIDVNILEQVSSQQYLDISSIDRHNPEDIDRFGLGKIEESQISGMQAVEKYRKLRVIGKLGSGKSIFLKHLAICCNRGQFAVDQVPIFITLRDFAETYHNNPQLNLLEFIHQEFITSDISQQSIIQKLLHNGKILFLIDGMDEVHSEYEHLVIDEIRRFCEKYYKNQFITSCRTASQKLALKGFTDVEIAPFTHKQITAFAQKWFVAFSNNNSQDGITKALQFIEKLELPENWGFRRLITTPLFLHLACSIFCRQGHFPIKQADFYKQGMDLLLGKWDKAKGIERDQVYRDFQLPQKIKLLSQISATSFEQNQYFFEQTVIERYISDYIQNISGEITDLEEIQQVSEAVLRAIEAQHGLLIERARGIFSFSYLALQEYFTARRIVASHNLQALRASLDELVSHIDDPHWREIFLLTTSMLRSADELMQLMKQKIDALVTDDPHLQEFLTWVNQKSQDNLSVNNKEISFHRDNSNQWKFNAEQQESLQKYYDANQLLLDCLNSKCEITDSVKLNIEAMLLFLKRILKQENGHKFHSLQSTVVCSLT